MKKPELVAPAGSLEKLEIAYLYGADAAYAGLKDHSLRTRAENFTFPELKKAVALSERMRKKLYLALNSYFYDSDLKGLDRILAKVNKTGCSTLIVSDPGVLLRIREKFPSFRVHLSTQANTTNSSAARFYLGQGVSRIILARELSLKEIAAIRKAVPKAELEVFVHGAMCLAYSGRCFLSLYQTGRNANRGDCSQPCRWEYFISDEKRPGDFLPVRPEGRGTAILSSRDLNLLDHIPSLVRAGVSAFKIEGRMKSLYYLAVTTAAYRAAIDAAWDHRRLAPVYSRELDHASHRPFFAGFIDGRTESVSTTTKDTYVRKFEFSGWVRRRAAKDLYEIEVKNPIRSDAVYEIVRWDDFEHPAELKDFELFRLDEEDRREQVPSLRIQDRGFVRTTLPLQRGWILRERLPQD
jgi:putative protease